MVTFKRGSCLFCFLWGPQEGEGLHSGRSPHWNGPGGSLWGGGHDPGRTGRAYGWRTQGVSENVRRKLENQSHSLTFIYITWIFSCVVYSIPHHKSCLNVWTLSLKMAFVFHSAVNLSFSRFSLSSTAFVWKAWPPAQTPSLWLRRWWRSVDSFTRPNWARWSSWSSIYKTANRQMI